MTCFSQRSDYLGQIKGMLSMLKETHESTEAAEHALFDHLERQLEIACDSDSDEKFSKAIFLMSAFFIHNTGQFYAIFSIFLCTVLSVYIFLYFIFCFLHYRAKLQTVAYSHMGTIKTFYGIHNALVCDVLELDSCRQREYPA